MKNTNMTRLWIKIGKLVAINPKVKILCPICHLADLEIKDIKNNLNSKELERHIFCNTCGAHNSLRLIQRDMKQGNKRSKWGISIFC